MPEEAITFCAYLLPGRAAVWWAHECLSQLAELLGDRDLELLALVHYLLQLWVLDHLHHQFIIIII